MLNAIMLNIVMLNAIMLNIVMLNAIMLNIVMLNVVAPNITQLFYIEMNIFCRQIVIKKHSTHRVKNEVEPNEVLLLQKRDFNLVSVTFFCLSWLIPHE